MTHIPGLPEEAFGDVLELQCVRCLPPMRPGDKLGLVEGNVNAGSHYLYAVTVAPPFPRANCKLSSVLYIGRGSGARVESLWKGGHSALHALARVLACLPRTKELVVVAREYDVDEVLLRESLALTQTARRFGETPPCNARWEGYILGRFLQALALKVAPELDGKPTHTNVYDSPTSGDGPEATYVDVYYTEQGWGWSLCWILPRDWGGTVEKHGGKLLVILPELESQQHPLDWGLKHAGKYSAVEVGDAPFGGIEDEDCDRLIRGLTHFQRAQDIAAIQSVLRQGLERLG